ncbi:hypothetical protein [Sphingomicrobium clamense]|uniref:Uncharacterized protein n=1 Tax=Sphingomicrobium clamense TaxID=2851013 RepID=A0ABS6V432_9SPHN|nr:hypothetical protein [Sphingomicrobium sp. B8]MBW0144317.1 hypothetical protein [Sphingomicrobium sp. B8]
MTRVSTLLAGMSAVALLVAPEARAQDGDQDTAIPGPIVLPNATPAPTPSPTPSGGIVAIPPSGQRGSGDSAVGPDSLRDFSLGGPTPAPRATPAPTPAPTPPPSTAPTRPSSTGSPPPARTNSPISRPEPPPPGSAGSSGRLTPVPPTRINPGAVVPEERGAPVDLPPPPEGFTPPESGTAAWPWLLALLALIGAGAFAWHRRRSGLALAGGPALERAPAPQPAPRPAPTPPPPQPETPKAPPAAPAGVITSSVLKPDLEIDVEPVRAVFSEEGLALDYRMTIANKGHGEARGLTIRQDFLFASGTQANDFDEFLGRPVDAEDKPLPTTIPPGTAIGLDAKAFLPLNKARAVIFEGRQLLLPILALGVRHGGQASAHKPDAHGMWLIGRTGGSDGRMAPIRADQGPRIIRDLELKRQ